MILVNVNQGEWSQVRQELVHLPGFEYLAVTSGGFDFVVLVRVRDVASSEIRGAPQVASHRRGQVNSDGFRVGRRTPASWNASDQMTLSEPLLLRGEGGRGRV